MSRALLTVLARSPSSLKGRALALTSVGLGLLAPLFMAKQSAAQVVPAPYDCRSTDPTKWPPSSKPYFMLAIDTSGSMVSCTDPAHSPAAQNQRTATCGANAVNNSCGLEPTRLNDAKCAVRKTVQAFAGEVNFGMMTYANVLGACNAGAVPDSCSTSTANNCTSCATNCGGEHYGGGVPKCTITPFANEVTNNGVTGCGNTPDCAGPSTNNALIYRNQLVDGASVPPVILGNILQPPPPPPPAVPPPPITSVQMPGDNWRNGGNVIVDMLKDPTWAPATQPLTNTPALLEWVDGFADNSHEIFADGFTPLGGILRTAHQYYAAGWSSAWTDANYCAAGGPVIDHPSPIDAANDRICRSLNVILVTDGDETCEGGAAASDAATALAAVGVVIQGVRVQIKTYVIGFAGATKSALDAIAAAGMTTASYSANNEVQLSQAIASIISGAVSPETCDNSDNNCNGCIDEGSKLYCNRNKTATALATLQGAATPDLSKCCDVTAGAAARTACLAAFSASITPARPAGNQSFLPCWNAATDTANIPTKWLCSDPGEVCDNLDNNCDTQIDSTQAASFATNVADENQLKCGSPLHCPQTETCDTKDQNCDGIIDNAAGSGVPFSICPNTCAPGQELCNGCDDDCDGIADNGIADVPCGFSPPAACAGVSKCLPVAVSGPGACIPGVSQPGVNQFGKCGAVGTTETCNGIDDNCDGIVDNNPTGGGAPCTPNPGDPVIGTCKAGTRSCENGVFVCNGYQGPTAEICDGFDNDCDGLTDAQDPNLVGVGKVCGSVTGRCTKGLTACAGGAIVCTGGNLPQPEICNGLDDDCNGVTDDALTDAPAQPASCWANPVSATCTTSCTAAGVTWCPPTGATCTAVGSLVGACKIGALVCEKKWVCRGDQEPVAELCNNQDDNCNGQTDENLGKPFGDVCGQTIPNTPCKAGILVCQNGGQVCQGGVIGQNEICNGLDDDCDGRIDNGVTGGGACTIKYDTTMFPGPRPGPGCQGVTQCDAASGAPPTCLGGPGPSPEICDGLDNDCDGLIDELGPAPDGIDGSIDPNDKTKTIGGPCGANQGQCKAGQWACRAGKFECPNSTGATPEVCDCIDNDCDGLIDEDPDPGTDQPDLCSTGKTCVQKAAGESCQCAAPCAAKEFPCPGGQTCARPVLRSGTTTEESKGFCLRADTCGDCTKATVKPIGSDTVECAPAGTQPTGGRPIPVCQCTGGTACHAPCFGKPACPAGEDCAPRDGTCQTQGNCFFFGCPTGQACTANGSCTDNACASTPCGADEVCKPSADFKTRTCVGSCASVTCGSGQACVSGKCQPTGCGTDCGAGEVCIRAAGDAGAASCGPSLCTTTSCPNGGYCDPGTGACGADPCEGVICPSGQVCDRGECNLPKKPPSTPDAGSKADSGSGGGAGNAGGSTGAGNTPSGNPKAAFGLATGGGGCACSVPANKNSAPRGLLLGLAALVAFRARKRPDSRTAKRSAGGVR